MLLGLGLGWFSAARLDIPGSFGHIRGALSGNLTVEAPARVLLNPFSRKSSNSVVCLSSIVDLVREVHVGKGGDLSDVGFEHRFSTKKSL